MRNHRMFHAGNLPNVNETSHGDSEAEAAVPGEILLPKLVLLHLEPLLQDLLEQSAATLPDSNKKMC